MSLKGLKDEGFNLVSVKKKKGKEAYIITSKKEDTDNFFMVEQHISIVEKGIAIVTIGSFENDFESMRATFQSILKELKIK